MPDTGIQERLNFDHIRIEIAIDLAENIML